MWYIHTLKKQNYTLITIFAFLTYIYSSSSTAGDDLLCWEGEGDGWANRTKNIVVKKEDTKTIHAGVSYGEPIWSMKNAGPIAAITCKNETTQDQKIALHHGHVLANTKLKFTVSYQGREIPPGGHILLDDVVIPALGKRVIRNFPGYDVKLYLTRPATSPDEKLFSPKPTYLSPTVYIAAVTAYIPSIYGYSTHFKDVDLIRSSPCVITANVSSSAISLGTITTEFLNNGGGVKNKFSITIKKEDTASCSGQALNLKTEFIHNTNLKDGAVVLATGNGTATGALMQLLDSQGKIVSFNKPIPLDLTNTSSITQTYQVNVKRDAKTVKFTGGKFSASVILKVSYA